MAALVPCDDKDGNSAVDVPTSASASAATGFSQSVEDVKKTDLFQTWKDAYEAMARTSANGPGPDKAKGCSASAKSGMLLDSCASLHIKGNDDDVIEGSACARSFPLTIDTVGGETTATHNVHVEVPGLGAREFAWVPGAPDLLSMGEVIKEGYDFNWKFSDFHNPTLKGAKAGKHAVALTVMDNCPMIVEPGVERYFAAINAYAGPARSSDEPMPKPAEVDDAGGVPVAAAEADATGGDDAELCKPCGDGWANHYVLHLPMRDDCKVCQLAKMTQTYHRRVLQHDGDEKVVKASVFGEKTSCDLIGPTEPDLHGNRYLQVFQDEATGWCACGPIKSKEASVTTAGLNSWLAGRDPDKLHVTDGGGEFKSEYDELLKTRGVRRDTRPPDDTRAKARQERFHRTLNDGARVNLVQSGLPYIFWSMAAIFFIWSYNRLFIVERTGFTPWVARYATECGHLNKSAPFGCLALTHYKGYPPKFGPRAYEGILIGYQGDADAYMILDLETFLLYHGRVKILVTRDVKLRPTTFPLHDPANRDAMKLFSFDLSPDSQYVCTNCNLIVTRMAVTCTNCSSRSKRRHARDATCRLGRCACPAEAPTYEILPEDEPSEPMDIVPSNNVSAVERDPAAGLFNDDVSMVMGVAEDSTSGIAFISKATPENELRVSHKSAGEILSLNRDELYQVDRGSAMAYATFGCVTKIIPVKSEKGRSPAALKAMEEEITKLCAKHKVWSWSTIAELSDVRKRDPTASFVRVHMLLGLKHSEDEALAYYKARLVALGNQVFGTHGEIIFEEEKLYVSPITMEASRALDVYAFSIPGGVSQTGDAECAYGQARLQGDTKVYLIFDEHLLPKHLQGKYVCAVVTADGALYGLQRAGFDWDSFSREKLVKAGWRQFADAQRSMFEKLFAASPIMVKLGAFVDDFKVAADDKGADAAWKELKQLFVLGEVTTTGKFAGICQTMHALSSTMTRIDYDQREYAALLCSRFMEARGLLKLAKRDMALPILTMEKLQDNTPGIGARDAPRHIGGLLFLARGTRGDISFAVNLLGRFVASWTVTCDIMLEHLFGYLWATLDVTLSNYVDVRDHEGLTLVTRVDSDHGHCPKTARSTSGAISMLTGEYGTRATAGWLARRQTHTSPSTGDAEVASVNDGIKNLCLPIALIVDILFGYTLPIIVESDATAALGAVRNGFGPMIYMAKTHRISHGFLHDFFEEPGRDHIKVHTDDNEGDLFTKALGNPRYCELRRSSGFLTERQRNAKGSSARWQNAYHKHHCSRCGRLYMHCHKLLGAHSHTCCTSCQVEGDDLEKIIGRGARGPQLKRSLNF